MTAALATARHENVDARILSPVREGQSVCAAFYGHPSQTLPVVGVTGTDEAVFLIRPNAGLPVAAVSETVLLVEDEPDQEPQHGRRDQRDQDLVAQLVTHRVAAVATSAASEPRGTAASSARTAATSWLAA